VLLDNWLAQRALTSPDRTALVADGRELTYLELERESTVAARRLAGLGVRRGSAVVLSLPAGVEYVTYLHALMKLGAVAVPLDTRLTERERADALAGLRPALEIREPAAGGGHEADLPLLGEIDLGAVCSRVMTSGTSGTPRAIGLTYGNHLWNAVGSAFNLGVDPGDRWLCCLPMFHVSGLSIVIRSVIYGTTAVVHRGFDAERVAESLRRDGVTVVSLVATALATLLETGAEVSAPRVILVGGGPVPGEVLEEAIGRGATVVQTYGLTEAASQVATLPPEDAVRKLGSAGRPLLTTHLRIEDGEILVQGPTVAPGCADEEGWLHTGDLGRIDDEGFLWVEGRSDELIVTGGENVSPAEVEGVLLRHPSVADAAVVGRDDRRWQRAVTAVLVLAEGAQLEEAELRRHCAAQLAAHKVPKRFEVTDELPRTAAGKLLRTRLSR
jgi:O-succinylbenzoic acid--CoA ligase